MGISLVLHLCKREHCKVKYMEGMCFVRVCFACRIPPGVFVKLHEATWHAGPFFSDRQHMDFYNLELADTNIVDHQTHVYDGKIMIEG